MYICLGISQSGDKRHMTLTSYFRIFPHFSRHSPLLQFAAKLPPSHPALFRWFPRSDLGFRRSDIRSRTRTFTITSSPRGSAPIPAPSDPIDSRLSRIRLIPGSPACPRPRTRGSVVPTFDSARAPAHRAIFPLASRQSPAISHYLIDRMYDPTSS